MFSGGAAWRRGSVTGIQLAPKVLDLALQPARQPRVGVADAAVRQLARKHGPVEPVLEPVVRGHGPVQRARRHPAAKMGLIIRYYPEERKR